jgi:iron complex outermembrane receptor protein
MWQSGRFALSVTSLYKRRNPQTEAALQAKISRSYWLVNLRARYDVTPAGSHLFVQAHNIGDVAYSDLLGARMPGRWLSGGLQLSF